MRSLLLTFIFPLLLALACVWQGEKTWMGPEEIGYVDCFFEHYRQDTSSVIDAELSCFPARSRSFDTYIEFSACRSEATNLYRSKYGGLDAEATGLIEAEMESLTRAVCQPERGINVSDLPYGTTNYVWMGPEEVAYVDCFVENHSEILGEHITATYSSMVEADEATESMCGVAGGHTYQAREDLAICRAEARALFRSRYDDLSEDAVAVVEDFLSNYRFLVNLCWSRAKLYE